MAKQSPKSKGLFLGLYTKAKFDANEDVSTWTPVLPIDGRADWLLEDTLVQRTLDQMDVDVPISPVDDDKLFKARKEFIERVTHAEITDYGSLRKEPVIQDLLHDVVQHDGIIYLKTTKTEAWIKVLQNSKLFQYEELPKDPEARWNH